MDNPGISLNFDAHALYNEEENELDYEDKQQENELKELLNNEFDDLDLDDDDEDEDSSSSDFSLYGNAAAAAVAVVSKNHQHHHHPHHQTTTTTTSTAQLLITNGKTTAATAAYHQQQKIVYQQQYSTPAINQMPPPPLQANINEQTINYEHHYNMKNDIDDDEQPRELIHPTPQLQAQQHEQQPQHEERSEIMDHLHIGNDHHLHNGDNDDDDDGDLNDESATANNLQLANGVQLEFNQQQLQTPKTQPNYNLSSNGLEMNNGGDMLDAEDNFEDLNINQFEFMNMDAINRQYGRLQLLYKVRGKKLEEVTNRFEAYQQDVNREVRAMKHRVNLAEKEKEQAQLSLEQSQQLCQQYQVEIQMLSAQNQDVKLDFEKLKELNENLRVKLQETNDEIEALNYQLQQQQNLDSIERVKVQHEQILTQLREKYEQEVFQLKENVNQFELELNEKHQLCDMLRTQLDQALKQSDHALIERGDTINRLNKRIMELQKQYDDLMVLRNLNSNDVSQTNMKLYEKINYLENLNQEREKYFQQLQDRNKDLEEQNKLYEAMSNINVSDSVEFTASSVLSSTANNNTSESAMNLRKELERALNLLKTKRSDIQKYQNEIQKLKEQIKSAASPPAVNLNMSQQVIDELNKEKSELQSDLHNLKLKLEESYNHTDEVNQHKQELENEIYVKNEQIEHLSNELAKLREQTNVNFMEERLKMEFNNEKLQLINKYELSMQSLKHDLDNTNADIIKLKQLYVDVCNEKNDIEDRLRTNYEKELKQLMIDYDAKIKQQDEEKAKLHAENEMLAHDYDLKVKQQDEEKAHLKADNEQLKAKFDEDRKKLEYAYKSELDNLVREKCELSEKLSNVDKERQVASSGEIESLNFKIKSYENQIENFKNEKFNLIERISTLEKETEQVKTLSTEIDGLNFKIKQFEMDVLKLEKEKSVMKEQLTALEDEKKNGHGDVQTLREKLQKYENEIETLNKNYLNEKMSLVKQENEKYAKLETKYDQLKIDYDTLNAKYKNEYNQLKTQNDEVNKRFSKELETRLNEELTKLNKIKANLESAYKIKETELSEQLDKTKQRLDQIQQQYGVLNEKCDNSKQVWENEKTALLQRKEEEFQKVIEDLEKRFEEDYSKFIQTYKENLAKTLQEKSDEYAHEKESLVNMYENKIKEFELKEQNLQKQIKDLKKSVSSPMLERHNVSELPTSSYDTTCERLHLTNLQQSSARTAATNAIDDASSRLKEENEALLKQIKQLEEMINNTDRHFEYEIDKLKSELEEDYRQRVEHELEQKEIEHQHLLNQLNLQNEQNLQNEIETLRKKFIATSENEEKMNLYKQQQQEKYLKLKQELNLRDKQVEQLEMQSKAKIDKLKLDYDRVVEAEKESYEKLRKDLDDQFKLQTQRIKQENENLQVFIQKLKKTNTDSDKVIQNLKDELNKTQAAHLDELKTIKLNIEREKESLQQKVDSLNSKLQKAEKLVNESDDRNRNELETMRTKLKQEYGQELSKMNAKMKDMMKSHASAIELLKKQHTADKVKHGIEDRNKPLTFATTCQTDVTFNDIRLLETFREKYLETINKMKSDMIRQFDEQTTRQSDKLRRELDEERKRLSDRIRHVFLKRLNDILRDYRVSDSITQSIIHELEQELNQVILTMSSQKQHHHHPLQQSTTTPSSITTAEIEHDINEPRYGARLMSPRSTTTTSSSSVENKRYQGGTNLTLQKHMDHDAISVRSADLPITTQNINRHYSANLRKTTTTTSADHVIAKQQQQHRTVSKFHDELKDLQPFYSSSLSSFQNHDAKSSDSGNGSSCTNDTSKHLRTVTPHQMTSSTTSTSSSGSKHEKQQQQQQHMTSFDEQQQLIDAASESPKSATKSNYKYTPLRQSWSNLNQFNQLSPSNFNQGLEQEIDFISENRKERPVSASNILHRTNTHLSTLNERPSSSKRNAENDILNLINSNNSDFASSSTNTIRSYSTHVGNKDSPNNEINRYASLPRSSTTMQQTNVKLLTIPSKTRPYSAGSMSSSSSTIGLSIFKDQAASGNVQTIEAKPLYNKTATTITTNNNYNYAIESDYYDQFIDDNLPVKELDVSSSTISSSSVLHNKVHKTPTQQQQQQQQNGGNVMMSTYQKLRTSVHSGSYRTTTAAPTSSSSSSTSSNSFRKAVTVNKINGDSTAISTGGAPYTTTTQSHRVSSGGGSSSSKQNQQITQSRKK